MRKLMQFLGFGDDEYDDFDDYEEQPKPARKPAPRPQKQKRNGDGGPSAPRLVLFKGIPSEKTKLRLRDAFRDGVMILLDFHELSAREFEEQGRPFITFMGGVAFASGGQTLYMEPAQYLVMPHEGMFEEWAEEETDDGTFDSQGR